MGLVDQVTVRALLLALRHRGDPSDAAAELAGVACGNRVALERVLARLHGGPGARTGSSAERAQHFVRLALEFDSGGR